MRAIILGSGSKGNSTLLIGKNIAASSYISAIVIAVIALVLFVLGIIFHKHIFAFIERKAVKSPHPDNNDSKNDLNDNK